jgi:protein-tyrosine phosphatase
VPDPADGWRPSATPVRLADGEVQLWVADVREHEPALEALLPLLDEHELSTACLFRGRAEATRFALRRALPRLAVSRAPVHVATAATDDLVVCAVSATGPVGCGIEPCADHWFDDQLVAAFVSPRERAQLAALSGAARTELFARCWAAKEALLAVIGEDARTVFEPHELDLPELRPLSSEWTLVEARSPAGDPVVAAAPRGVAAATLLRWPRRAAARVAALPAPASALARLGIETPTFVDVHTHVLPGVDDGFDSLAQALDLCREAREHGTRTIFATPHVAPRYPLTSERERLIRTRLDALRASAAVEVRLGFELDASAGTLELDLRRLALEGTAAVLVDTPLRDPIDTLVAVAEQVEALGLVPIVAHPEEGIAILREPRLARELAARGWPLQVNARNLLGRRGPLFEATAWSLVRSGAAFVATDAHTAATTLLLDTVFALLVEHVPDEARRLVDGTALPLLAPEGLPHRGVVERSGAGVERARPPEQPSSASALEV